MAELINPSGEDFLRAGHVGVRSDPGLGVTILTRFNNVWALDFFEQDRDPRFVDEFMLEAMTVHPSIYLAERMTTGVIRREDLFSVKHKDPKLIKETEEWLWPLLPRVLNAFARAYSYGSRGLIFDWGTETLTLEVPTGEDGTKTRTKRLPDHKHFVKAHNVRRSEFTVTVKSDDLESIEYFSQKFPATRAFVLRWDPQTEGDWRGQGALIRAWRDFCALIVIELLEANYLERSVDPPRVAKVPEGSQTVDGIELDNAQYAIQLLMSQRGSGATAWPSARDEKGNALWELSQDEISDRETIWVTAIKRREVRLMISYLALLGADLAAAATKTLDGMLKEFIQDIANWVATGLTEIVEIVHKANHDTDVTAPPEIKATEVGKASALKLLKEVLALVDGAKVTTWLDVQSTLDRLGVPVLDEPEPPPLQETPPPSVNVVGEPGPNKDMTGAREERREDARTSEGEEDTGQREGRENEQLAAAAISLAKELASRPLPAPADIHLNIATPGVTIEGDTVTLNPPSVTVEPAKVEVTVEAAQAPTVEVNVEPPPLQETPPPSVNVVVNVPEQPAPDVTVNVNPELKVPPRDLTIRRDSRGFITGGETK